MAEQIVNEGVADSGESFVKDHGFAAVPIHFTPAEGKEKKIALVIPGIEPPLAFFRIAGDSPDQLVIEEVDGHVDSVSAGSKDEESTEDVDLDTEEVSESEESEDGEESQDEDLQAEEDEQTLDYPHEDEAGDPVAGFLIGNEDAQPPVVVVRPQDGEASEEAMKRVGENHPEHYPGSLEDATKLLGHSPLTSGDT
jgi:hypothetical protein